MNCYPKNSSTIEDFFVKLYFKGMIVAYFFAMCFWLIYVDDVNGFLKVFSFLGLFLAIVLVFISKVAYRIIINFDDNYIEFFLAKNGKSILVRFDEILEINDQLWLTFQLENRKIYLNRYIGGKDLLDDIERLKTINASNHEMKADEK